MDEILIATYIVLNAWIIYYYLKNREDGVFTPPFIISAISLTVMLPQLTTIYYVREYDNSLLPTLCYTMITCNLAFLLGFRKGEKRKLPRSLYDIDLEKCKFIVFALALSGFGAWLGIGDGVIVALFMGFSQMAICYGLVYCLTKNNNYSKIYCISIVLGCIIVLNYIFFIYGSRGSSLFLFLAFMYFLYLKKPKRKRFFKLLVVGFLLFGSIVSASITLFRQNIHGGKNNIDYIENFKEGFMHSDSEVGMDLGNGAILIDYCKKHDSYNYGAIFWNGFVGNFIPERVVGEETKESLQYFASYEKLILPITNGITTVTGYFEAFATWGYLGFFCFFILGYISGVIWTRAKYSNFYMILLLFSLGNFPLMITHNLQYILQRWEQIIMFSAVFCFFALKKKKL